MNTDFIDLIYQNEEVEGVAVFTAAGELIENQLALTEESAIIVARTIANIAASLSEVTRTLKGFLMKSDKMTIQVCVYNHIILVMELTDPSSANRVEKSVRSILSGILVAPVVLQAGQAKVVKVVKVVEGIVEESVEEDIVAADLTDFAEFRSKITTLLKRVAPGGIADKMIDGVLEAEGIDLSSEAIDRATAVRVGQMIVDKIPNASRRKIISKEYAGLSQNF